MNQEQVKAILLDIAEAKTEFNLILSGKESKLVNGLYKPESREIILHNRNFNSDDQLIYTAIHEYAHHLHGERKGGLASGRAHTNEFWALFHDLLAIAEEKGLYRNLFETEASFVELTQRIKKNCIAVNGEVMLEFGKLMIEAQALCNRYRMRFEDYVDRALGVPRNTAFAASRVAGYSIPTDIGWDGMVLAAGIGDSGERSEAIAALRSGSSPAVVKMRFAARPEPEDVADRLAKEEERLERTIRNLEERLAEVRRKLAQL